MTHVPTLAEPLSHCASTMLFCWRPALRLPGPRPNWERLNSRKFRVPSTTCSRSRRRCRRSQLTDTGICCRPTQEPTSDEWWADVLADPRARKRKRRTDLAVKQAFYRLADERRETILVACSTSPSSSNLELRSFKGEGSNTSDAIL